MNKRSKFAAPLVLVLAAACSTGSSPDVPWTAGQNPTGTQSLAFARLLPNRAVRACNGDRHGKVQCGVLVRMGIGPNGGVAGFTPADLQAAYDLPSSTRGSGQIVAIVDAYDNPNVAFDLAKYRSHFGLPKAHFKKYNEFGQTRHYPTVPPPSLTGWDIEIDLDVEMVSASCPKCTIYLVEAYSVDFGDIAIAEAEAVKLGATIVSNSFYGTPYEVGVTQSYFQAKHVTYLASAGDNGYGIGYPADYGSVVAVGGTTLVRGGGSRGWTESVWDDTGSGCSTDPKPKWQHNPSCAFRTANDVSAVADPNTGVAEYDSFGEPGWFVSGGTSVGAPLLAGVFGLAGNSTKQDGGKTFWEKKHAKDLFPVTTGSNGSCSPAYLCTAGTNTYGSYSGPTGWGTPNGIGAF